MNIIETLKNIDFEKQYIEISFENYKSITIGQSIVSKEHENKFKKARFISFEDGFFTFEYDSRIFYFKPSCINHLEINNIIFVDDRN